MHGGYRHNGDACFWEQELADTMCQHLTIMGSLRPPGFRPERPLGLWSESGGSVAQSSAKPNGVVYDGLLL